MIEAAGAKGWRQGGAQISELHANFIVNCGNATRRRRCEPCLARARRAVADSSGVDLELGSALRGGVRVSKERVAVVMGGPGSERDVSLASGRGVLDAFERLGYPSRSLDFDERFIEAVRDFAPDVVFNALHGTGGEDGTLQGVLDWLRVPYTGSDLRSCALSIDKHLTKKLLSPKACRPRLGTRSISTEERCRCCRVR